ncbi:MAG: hypothetical protein OXL34_01950 [Gemmatimonadota bacterium]|nr:hypothetical protein [Gemmatimonadota bacterium]
MKKHFETWVPVAAIVASAVTATWVVSGRIGEVRADLSKEMAALDSRLSGVEAKLDLLIEGLDIDVSAGRAGE